MAFDLYIYNTYTNLWWSQRTCVPSMGEVGCSNPLATVPTHGGWRLFVCGSDAKFSMYDICLKYCLSRRFFVLYSLAHILYEITIHNTRRRTLYDICKIFTTKLFCFYAISLKISVCVIYVSYGCGKFVVFAPLCTVSWKYNGIDFALTTLRNNILSGL